MRPLTSKMLLSMSLGVSAVLFPIIASAAGSADLSIASITTNTNGTVRPGQTVSYTVTAANAGPSAVTNANLGITFAADLTPVKMPSSCILASGKVTCANIALASGQRVPLAFEFKLQENRICSMISFIASLSSPTVTDPSPSLNNNRTLMLSCARPGDLYVTQALTIDRPRQLLGGTVGDSILRLNFRADKEDIEVTDLQITSVNAQTRSIDSLALHKEGADNPFAIATIAACGNNPIAGPMTFCATLSARQLLVLKGTSITVLVKPRVKSDVDGAVSGEAVQLFLSGTPVIDAAKGNGAVRARGLQSGIFLSGNNGNSLAQGEIFVGNSSVAAANVNITGNKNVTVLSKIREIAKDNGSPSDGTLVPTVPGSDLMRFKISAASHSNSKNGLNKVVLSGVVFNVTAMNTAIDTTSFKFYNIGNFSVSKSCTPYTAAGFPIFGSASGSFVVVCTQLQNSNVNVTMEQGTDKTFGLRANITSTNAFSSLQASLQNFDSPLNTVFGLGSSQSHLEWIDSDASFLGMGNSTASVFRWLEYPEATVKGTSFKNN